MNSLRTLQSYSLEDCMSAIIDYRGKTPRKTNHGVPLITARIVKGGRIETPNEFIDPSEYEEWMRRGIPKVGDVLITTEAPLGEVAQLTDGHVALAQRLILLRGNPEILDNSYLKYLLMSDGVQEQLQGRASGTTVLGIKQSELRKINLDIPHINEQREIVAVISALDEKIEKNRTAAKTLENFAWIIFRAWFVDFDPMKAKASGAISFPTMPQYIFDSIKPQFLGSEIGSIPNGWGVKSLSDICIIVGGGTPKRTEELYWNGSVPWYSVRDVPDDGAVWFVSTDETITEEGVLNSSARMVPKGCTIISARGTVGKLAMAGMPVTFNQSCYGLLPKDGFSFCYLYLLMRSVIGDIQQRAHGSVFDTITRATFDSVSVVSPTEEILTAFESMVSPLFDLMLATAIESKKLAEIRDYLLPKLIRGSVRMEATYG